MYRLIMFTFLRKIKCNIKQYKPEKNPHVLGKQISFGAAKQIQPRTIHGQDKAM